MKFKLALFALGVAACGGPDTTTSPTAQTTVPTARKAAARFTLEVDPARGTARVTPLDVASTGKGLHSPATVEQDGVPNSGTGGTFELVTTAARLPGIDGCPGTDNCFVVTLNSFAGAPAGEVVLVVDDVVPARVLSNSDAAPAGSLLSSAFGMINFGGVGANGSSTREIRFVVPNLDYFVATLSLHAEVQAPANCAAILAANPGSPSRNYVIDVDGAGGAAPFLAYCDMVNEGGGWTLIHNTVPLGGADSVTLGEALPGNHSAVTLARMQALANAASQVHLRTTSNPAESITSVANNAIIANLRLGNLLNQGLSNPMSSFFTGTRSNALTLDYSCGTSGSWPGIYWACGNVNGLHLLGTHSRWEWQGGNTALNIGMQLYVR